VICQDLAAQLEKLSLKSEPFILQPRFWEDEGGGDVPGNCAPLLVHIVKKYSLE